jgi:hypothetical protein
LVAVLQQQTIPRHPKSKKLKALAIPKRPTLL